MTDTQSTTLTSTDSRPQLMYDKATSKSINGESDYLLKGKHRLSARKRDLAKGRQVQDGSDEGGSVFSLHLFCLLYLIFLRLCCYEGEALDLDCVHSRVEAHEYLRRRSADHR